MEVELEQNELVEKFELESPIKTTMQRKREGKFVNGFRLVLIILNGKSFRFKNDDVILKNQLN